MGKYGVFWIAQPFSRELCVLKYSYNYYGSFFCFFNNNFLEFIH